MSPVAVKDYYAEGTVWSRHGYPDITSNAYVAPAYGTYDPDETTSGVEPLGVGLTTVTPGMTIPGTSLVADSQGNVLVSTANTVLRQLYFPTGFIDVNAANVWVDQCYIAGYNETTQTANKALVSCTRQAAMNTKITDTTLIPAHPGAAWNGVTGHDFTAERVHIENTTDGFGIFNSNSGHTTDALTIVIKGCYVNNLVLSSPDANHASDTPISASHNDVIQFQGSGPGSSIEIAYCNFQGFLDQNLGQAKYTSASPDPVTGGYNAHAPYFQASSVFQIKNNVTTIYGLNVHDVLMDGGAFTVNCAAGTYPNLGSFTNIRFGRNQRPGSARTMSIPTAATVTLSNLTYADDGSPITVVRF